MHDTWLDDTNHLDIVTTNVFCRGCVDAKAFFADAEVVVSSVEEVLRLVLRLQGVDSSEAASHQGSLVGSTLTNGPA